MNILSDRYEIIRPLGRGRHARVVLAWDRKRERSVALKIFHSGAFGFDAESWARREFERLHPLKHPGFVRVLSFTIDPVTRQPFMVQEAIEGPDILTALAKEPLKSTLQHLVSLCRVLEYVHSKDLVHGDLRPDHIRVCDRKRVVLLDPLLPPEAAEGESRPIFGSLGYQAPEILRRQPFDARADLYAMGVVLYQLLTGHHPFPAADPVDVIRHQLQGDPVAPATLNPGVASSLSNLCLRLLSRDPGDRFDKASDVILEINERLGGSFLVETVDTRAAYLLDPPLVGREKEIGVLDRMLEDVRREERGQSKALLLEGPRGIGKARLQAEAARRAAGLGFHILHTQEPFTDPVLGPFAQWIEELRRRGRPGLSTQKAPVLEGYLRGQSLPDDPEAQASIRERLLSEAVSVFLGILPGRPLLVCVPDLHRLPDLAFDLFSQILAAIDRPRALAIVAAVDSEEMVSIRKHQLQRLREEDLIDVLPLPPLEDREIEELLERLFEPAPWVRDLAPRLQKATGGNLSGILESLRVLVDEGNIVRHRRQWNLNPTLRALPLPEGLRTAVQRRLELLDDRSRELVEVLGLLERASSAEELAGVLDDDPNQVVLALALLRERGFIRESAQRESLRLAPHIAEIFVPLMALERRRVIHERILHYLERSPEKGDEVQLARHAIGAEDSESIARYAARASKRAAERLDYRTALDLIDEALPHAETDRDRADLLLAKARLELGTGWLAASARSFESLHELATQLGDDGLLWRAIRGTIQASFEVGDLDRCERTIEGAVAALDPRDERHGEFAAQYALILLERGDIGGARARFASHLIAQDRVPKTRTWIDLARLHALEGRLRRALALLSRAERHVGGKPDLSRLGQIRLERTSVLIRSGRFDEAEKILLEVVTSARQLAERSHVMGAYSQLGLIYAHRGECEQARGWLDRARTLAVVSGHSLREAEAEAGLGMVCLVGLRQAEALQHFERSLHIHQNLSRPLDLARTLIWIGTCHRMLGRYESALEAFDRVETIDQSGGLVRERALALVGKATIHRRLGRLDEAEDGCKRVLDHYGTREDRDPIIAAQIGLGWVHLDRGAYAFAEACLSKAMEVHRDSSRPELDWEALAGLGEIALLRGDRERAALHARQLLHASDAPGHTIAIARGHLLMAEAQKGPPASPDVESHMTDAVLLVDSSGDRELQREIVHRVARLREESGQEHEALELYARSSSIVDEIASGLSDEQVRERYLRSGSRDRASRASQQLENRLKSRDRTEIDARGPSSELLLSRLSTLVQTTSTDEFLSRASETLLELLAMPLGFGLLAEGGTPVRLIGTGATEGESLGSSRIEGAIAVVRRCLMTGEILVCADVIHHSDYRGLIQGTTHPLRSFVCLPMQSTSRPGRVLGALFAGHYEPMSVPQLPSTRRLATFSRGLAGHLACLLEVGSLSRARTELSEEKKTLNVLRRTAEALGRSWDLDSRMEATLDIVRRALDARRLAIVDLAEEPGRVLWIRERHPLKGRPRGSVSRGVLDTMLASGGPVCVQDVRTTPPFNSFRSVHDMQVRSVSACPVRVRGEIVAALYSDQGSMDPVNLPLTDFLEALTRQIGLAFERDRLDQELERSRQQIESILESAPYPVVAVDSKFVLRAWNHTAERETGWTRDDIIGLQTADFLLSRRYDQRVRIALYRLLKRQKHIETELWLQRSDGSEYLAAVTARATLSTDGRVLGYTSIVRDLTKERDAEAMIQRSEHIIQQINEGVLLVDGDNLVTKANPACEKLLGYDDGELSDQPIEVLWSGDTPAPFRESLEISPENPWRGETLAIRKDQTTVPVAVSLSSMRDDSGVVIATVAVISDISVRKRHEDELRRLSDRIISAQEEERRRLARELHDESGQALAALKINLEYVRTRLPESSGELKDLLEDSFNVLGRTQQEFRRLAADLHPAVLENFGLLPALRRYTSELSKASGLSIGIEGSGGAAVLSGRHATALYRIAQEAMTNVVRHAKAKRIRVRLQRRLHGCDLVVADDGIGIVSSEDGGPRGIGIIGMRERAMALGGRVVIRSSPGRGTVVRARLPLGPESPTRSARPPSPPPEEPAARTTGDLEVGS